MKSLGNTTISLGLVNLPVQVVQATESGNDVSFKMCSPTGDSVEQKYIAPDGSTYSKGECGRAVEVSKGVLRQVDMEAVSAISEQTKLNVLNIDEVVPAIELWSRAHRITGHYYIQMNAKAGNANATKLFVDALEQDNLCMVSKWTPRTRQEQIVLHAKDGVLHGYSVEFMDNHRDPDEGVKAHQAGTYTDAEMTMAKQLLGALKADKSSVLDTATDTAIPLRKQLVADALAGNPITAPATPQQVANTGLMDSLAASLAALKDRDKVPA